MTSVVAQPRLFINEVCAANLTGITDEAGEHDDWIELFNAESSAVSLSGWFMTDDRRLLRKWSFPSSARINGRGFLLLWADNGPEEGALHLNFKPARSGEWLALVAPDGRTIVDSVRYGEQAPDFSSARAPDGGEKWLPVTLPTPGAANSLYPAAAPPRFSLSSGIYPAAQQLSIIPQEPGATVYYTLDGSMPDPMRLGSATFLYSFPLRVEKTTVVRARAEAPVFLPGVTSDLVLFIDPPHKLPIISLIVDPDDLFDPVRGIDVNGDSSGSRWERPCRMSYFPHQQPAFEIPAGIRVQGNSGRKMEKKSFRLFFRKRYGRETLDYPLFGKEAAKQFQTLVLRAGYDDDLQKETGTLLRDPLVSELYRRLDLPVSHSRFAALYLNDRFWGIYDLREDVTEDFIKAYYDLKDPDIIRLRWGYNQWEVDCGDGRRWQEFLDFVAANSFESDEMLARLAQEIDVNAFTDLQALVHAFQYRSWTYGGFFFRDRVAPGPWRLTIWDMDRSLTLLNWNGFSYYEQPSGEYWINFIVKKMLQNPGYRRYFINRTADLLNTAFLPQKSTAILDSLAQVIEADVPLEVERWAPTSARYARNLEALRTFLTVRPDTVFRQMQRFFGLPEAVPIRLAAPHEGGILRFNSLLLEKQSFTGRYFPRNAVDLTALPDPGWLFAGWSDPDLPQKAAVRFNPREGLSIEAHFLPEDMVTPVINEIFYSPQQDWDCGCWVELYNPASHPISAAGWTLAGLRSEAKLFFPAAGVLPPDGFIVCAQRPADFKAFYPDVEAPVFELPFALTSNDGLLLCDAEGRVIDQVRYTSEPPWPEEPGSRAVSLALIAWFLDRRLPTSWSAAADRGSPASENRLMSIKDTNPSIRSFELRSNYPNPFNERTAIPFSLAKDGWAELSIFDLRGRLVETLISAPLTAGEHTAWWSARHRPSGIYIVRLRSGGASVVRKIVVQK